MKIHLLLASFLLPTLMFAQSSCPNLDFEDGDFNNWNGTYGCNPINPADYEMYYDAANCSWNSRNGVYTTPSGQTLDQPQASNPNNLNGQQAIVSSNWNGGVDPYVPLLSLTPPTGGNRVARIGDYYNGARVGELSYNITVDSNNSLLTAYYAIVLEAPGGDHDGDQNPYFRIRLLDPDDNSVECVEYIQDGVAGAEGFNTYDCGGRCTSSADGNRTDKTNLIWRDWTAISVNLLPYMGQNVTVEFISGDCALTGHLGYAYIDLSCRRNEILAQKKYVCKGVTAEMQAPSGMSDYTWHYGDSLGPVVGNTQNISVADTGWYYCAMTPYSTAVSNCPYTLGMYIEQAPSDPIAEFTYAPNPVCIGEPVQFTDASVTADNSPISTWEWNFGDNSALSYAQNPSHSYTDSGTYTVQLAIVTIDGCLDTIAYDVTVRPLLEPEIAQPVLVCSEDAAFNLSATPLGGVWSGPGITDTALGTFDPIIAFASGNSATVRYSIGLCDEFAEITIDILPQKIADFTPAGPFCNDDAIVTLSATEAGGVWSGTGVNASGQFNPATAAIGNNTIKYAIPGACGDSVEHIIVVNERLDASIDPINPVCEDEDPIQIIALTPGGDWSGTGVDANGVFSPSVAGPGSHNITYSFGGACPDSENITIVVEEKIEADFPFAGPFCNDDPVVNLNPTNVGGTWSGTGVDANGNFNPATATLGNNLIKYSITGVCSDSSEQTIVVNRRKDASISAVGPFCNDDAPIQIMPLELGGTWLGNGLNSTGLFTPSIAGPGMHEITHILDGPCPDTATIVIEVLERIDPNFSSIGPFCEIDAPVQITAVSPGGSWSGVGIDANGRFSPGNVGPGKYPITYSFSGMCATSFTDTITVEAVPDASINPVDPLCYNSPAVQLTTATQGGVWSGDVISTGIFDPAQTGPGMFSAYYTITGVCIASDSINIIVTEPIAIVSEVNNARCKDFCDGRIELTTTGGWTAAPYTYLWSTANAANTRFRNDLCADDYKVIVSDLYACADSIFITITEPDSLLHQIVSDSSTCNQNNGIAEIVGVTGGTPPYLTEWENGVNSMLNANIGAGDYPVKVSDSQQCQNLDTAFIGNIIGPDFDVNIDPLLCFGATNAAASLTNIDGGVKPYTIQWSTGQNNNLNSHLNLGAGSYTVTVYDASGCQKQKSFSITEPTRTAVISPVDPMCEQAGTVQLQASALGGVWTGNGVSATGLFDPALAGPGVHEITYTQVLPCVDQDKIEIEVIRNEDPNFTPAGPFCSSADTIILTPTQNNGTWSGIGINDQGIFSPSAVGTGQYAITYTIAGKCGGKLTRILEVLPQSDASISGPRVLCPKDNPVQLTATQPGGTWSGDAVDANGIFYPAIAPIEVPIEITYIIAGSCPDTGKMSILVNPILSSDITPAGPFCNDESQKQLIAETIGGTWSGNGITNAFSGSFSPIVAGPGLHEIVYTIAGNCGSADTITIEVIARPNALISDVDPQCYNNAPITFSTAETGGVWSGAADAQGGFNPSANAPGKYTAYYSFSGSCPSFDSTVVTVLSPIAIDEDINDATCNTKCNGTVQLTVTGGWENGNYNYNWTNNLSNKSNQNGLCAGEYAVVVSDKYQCADSTSITIQEPNALVYEIISDSTNCGQSDGRAEVINTSGGTAPYSYNWSNGVTTAQNENIKTGTYNVSINDANGCRVADKVVVGDKAGPKFNVDVVNLDCFGDTKGIANIVNINGGTAPYTAEWSTGTNNTSLTHNNLGAGSYMVSITDANGCAYNTSFAIDQPTKLNLDISKDTTLCIGQSVELTAMASGGTPAYQYFWNEVGPRNNKMMVTDDVDYNVYALDANNCPSPLKSVTVKYNQPLSLDAEALDTILCEGESTTLNAIITGGVGDYNLLWDDGSTLNPRNYTPAGQYGDTVKIGVTISDMCSPDIYDVATIVFYEPARPDFEAYPTEGCEPLVVEFVNLSQNVATYDWDLGDGTQHQKSDNFSHVYQTGVYDVKLNAVSPDGCKAEVLKTKFIKTYSLPTADFSYSPNKITREYDQIQFIDQSLGQIAKWEWTFYEEDSAKIAKSIFPDPIVPTPQNLGSYIAKLKVTTEHGCVDSIYKTFDIEPDFSVYVPNAYTPNTDGVNEVFKPIVRGIQEDHYRLNIYDRWGELIWFTTDPDEGWKGTMKNNPVDIVKTDVYVWQLTVRDFKGKQHDYIGHVSLLK